MQFKDAPIRRKLMKVILLTSGAVLLLTCTVFFAYELVTFRQTTVRQLSTVGKIIGANSTAALAFDSRDDANEILASLKAERHIVAAGLYDSKGNLFSHFPADLPINAFPLAPETEGYHFDHSHLIGFQAVVQGSRRLGTLYLKSDMGAMYERFLLYGGITLVVIVISFLLAYLLSRSLQKGISKPILALAETAKVISVRQDYSVRATKMGEDELGLLTDSFNHMLTQIQEQNLILREREQQLSSIYDTVGDTIFVLAVEGSRYKFISVNKAFQVTTGIPFEGVAGKYVDEIIQQPSLNLVLEKYKKAMAEKKIMRWEETSPYPTGLLTGEVSIAPVFDEAGNCTRLIGAVHDITDRKKAEEEIKALNQNLEKKVIERTVQLESNIQQLKESEEKLKVVLDSGQIGAWDLNLADDTAWRSLLHDQIFGYAQLLPVWGYEIFVTHVVPEDREYVKQRFEEAYSKGKFSMECRIKRANDNSIRWIAAQGVAYKNEKGELTKMMGIVIDITDRKQTEETIKQLNRQLENNLHQLESVNKELEAFSYSVSHDLRAPLRSLEGFSNALSENYKGKFDEDADRWLDFITANAKRMDLLIRDMLNFSRISRDNIKNSSFNMKVLAQECFESSKMSYPRKDINFCLENLPDSYGDMTMIRQVWQNLISNALKYSSKNENIKIAITGKIENDFTVYSIKDNGVGFDEKYKDKLFQVFQRLHSNKEFEGTGVGLAIINRIIQKHNGWITASGQPGKGAEFIFALPIHRILENTN